VERKYYIPIGIEDFGDGDVLGLELGLESGIEIELGFELGLELGL
jgi:hypothetical protein